MSVRWFAEQDEEEGDMENINHFLIFHPEVGWGGQGQTKAEQGLCSFTWAASLSVCRLGEADQRDDTGKSMAV